MQFCYGNISPEKRKLETINLTLIYLAFHTCCAGRSKEGINTSIAKTSIGLYISVCLCIYLAIYLSVYICLFMSTFII